MIHLVVFDMAGTTVKDGGLVMGAMGRAMETSGYATDRETLLPWMGTHKLQAFQHLLRARLGPDNPEIYPEAERINRAYDEAMLEACRKGPLEPIGGATEAFGALREMEIKIALTTGFSRDVQEEMLDCLGWKDGIVDAWVNADDVSAGRPAPYMIFRAMEATGIGNVAQVAKVGDSTVDLQAGTNAGAAGVIGVLTGVQSAADLGTVRHTHIIPSVAALPALLDSAFRNL